MHAEKQLIEAFTGKSHLQDSSDSEWAALTAQYPAFTLGHYFRAKRQLANTGSGSAAVAADKDVQKSLVRYSAAKHFNDVLWLDYLLKHDFKQQKEDTTADKAPVMEAQAAKQAHDPSYTLQSLGNTAAEAKDKIVMPTAAHTDKKNHQGAGITQNQVAGDLKKEAPQAATDEAAATDDTVMDDTVTDDMSGDNSRLTAVLTAQLADFKKPLAANARLEVQREPLYKVDYFAFQGISIVKNQDGLDKKVRKFTDWLKEMKQQTPDNSGIP